MRARIEVWLMSAAERSTQRCWWVKSESRRYKRLWIAVYHVLAVAWLAAWINDQSITANSLFHLAKRMIAAINLEFPIQTKTRSKTVRRQKNEVLKK